jgi:PEP-CTERM motif
MKNLVAIIAAVAFSSQATASVLTEDFSDLPGWESNWFGTQSNAKNYYQVKNAGTASSRGNNPDGLWLDDNDGVDADRELSVVFDTSLAASMSIFSIDVASYLEDLTLVFFDGQGQTLFSQAVTPTFGATSTPGIYQNFTVSSLSGIGGFSLLSSYFVEGNVSVDNLFALTQDAVPQFSVPEPSSLVLFGLGAIGLMLQRRRLV